MTKKELLNLRNDMYAWSKIELNGVVVFNEHAKMDIIINKRGLKHTLKGKSFSNPELFDKNEAMIMSVRKLNHFFEKSQYNGFVEDYKKRDNVKGFHIFTNTFEYKNNKYNVKILVKETVGKTYFYDQALIDKK